MNQFLVGLEFCFIRKFPSFAEITLLRRCVGVIWTFIIVVSLIYSVVVAGGWRTTSFLRFCLYNEKKIINQKGDGIMEKVLIELEFKALNIPLLAILAVYQSFHFL